ncbi:peptide-binding protein [bacterium]|nr:peptide-binding protein [bacterium]
MMCRTDCAGKAPGTLRSIMRTHVLTGVLLLLLMNGLSCTTEEQGREAGPKKSLESKTTLPKRPAQTLVRELSSDPQNLNPVLSTDSHSSNVQELIFESLFTVDSSPDFNYVGRLAESWEISEDKLTLFFTVRKGITWHDGQPFTAEDVKFTFDMAMRSDIPALSMKSIVEPLLAVVVEDPYKVKFQFKYAFSPALLYIGATSIIPKHRFSKEGLAEEAKRRGLETPPTFVTSDFSRNPIGTGPYIFKEWKTNQHLKFSRNDNYWDKANSPKIKEVIFKILHNRSVAFNVMMAGELDVLRGRPIQFVNFNRQPSLQREMVSESFFYPVYYYLGWNSRPERKVFTDKRVRQAMTHALDREAFIEKILFGQAQVITGPFYFQSWAYNHAVKPLEFNLDKAAQLLREAGWQDLNRDGILEKDGVNFEFDILLSSGSAIGPQLCSIMQANLKKLYINANIVVTEWSVLLEKIESGNFDAVFNGWTMGIEPDAYGIWHSSQIAQGNNYVAYRNDEVDRLLVKNRKEFDRTEREKICQRIHELIHDDQPYTFICSPKEIYFLSQRVKKYQISPLGLFGFFPSQLSWELVE